MAWLRDLDAAIQQCLAETQISGKRAFRSVGPLPATGRSPVPDAMLAADKPAIFYAIRRLAEPGAGVLAEVQTLLIAEGLRGVEAAWRGHSQAPGAYELAEAAARALADLNLAGTVGLWLRHQQLAHADGRVVAFAQEYDVAQAGEQILIDGVEVIGGRSLVRLKRAAESARWQSEKLAGSEQCWASWQGRGPQAVVFEGTLWATDEATLQQIELALEGMLADRCLHTLGTGSGRSWPDVALVTWQRTSERIAQPMLGLSGQPIRIEFEQYLQ